MSAYGLSLADIVYEAQEPCAKVYCGETQIIMPHKMTVCRFVLVYSYQSVFKTISIRDIEDKNGLFALANLRMFAVCINSQR